MRNARVGIAVALALVVVAPAASRVAAQQVSTSALLSDYGRPVAAVERSVQPLAVMPLAEESAAGSLVAQSDIVNVSSGFACRAWESVLDVEVTITNNGVAGSGQPYTASFPRGMLGVVGSCAVAGGSGNCTVSASGIDAELSLAPSASVTLTYQVRVPRGSTVGTAFC